MILWTIKLISSVRKAVAGRRYPAQLAWAVAFGLLLGLIPHGNFLTVALVLLVLSLKLNHAMAALVTIAVTFAATNFDSVFHELGRQVLSHPSVAAQLTRAWDLPMMPWTDLNNSVVMGSFLIGMAALLPAFALTYPIFRYWSLGLAVDDDAEIASVPDSRRSTRSKKTSEKSKSPTAATVASAVTPAAAPLDVRRIDASQNVLPAPHLETKPTPKPTQVEIRPVVQQATSSQVVASRPVPAATSRRPATTPENAVRSTPGDDQKKIDEALRYLLRQLRDSQDKDAA